MAGKNDKTTVTLRVENDVGAFLILVADLAGESVSTVCNVLLAAWMARDRERTRAEIEARLEREEIDHPPHGAAPVADGGIARAKTTRNKKRNPTKGGPKR